MIDSTYYHKIKYKYPDFSFKGDEIRGIIGIDTEAYENGKPFLICFSDGTSYTNFDIPSVFFKSHYVNRHFSTYNLKYDSGALIYDMPDENKLELWEKNFTKWNGILVEYIPHKYLSFSKDKKHKVHIWDISQFYGMSLNGASKKYLDKQKTDIETKKFSVPYVAKNLDRIKQYCIQDSVLCSELSNFFVAKLSEFGIRTTALYSGASLSLRYFADNTKIVNVWYYWQYYPDLLKYAMDSYEGGKFEVTSRGYFKDAYEYDLCSAYPYEIKNLYDISLSKVVHSAKYQKDATYGFLRVRINNSENKYIPCGKLIDNVRVYLSGLIYATITKQEYDYLTEIDVDTEIVDGYWIVLDFFEKPYEKVVDTLFQLKSYYKNKDEVLYNISKRMLNSFYGKTVQIIENYKDEYIAGSAFNPVHGAVITANTRIKMCRIQNMLKDKCIAVHTDSVITTEELDKSIITGKLGELDFVEKGECICIACGQYSIGEKSAYKGIEPLDSDDWRTILKRHYNQYSIEYPVLHVHSWYECASRGKLDKINLFEETVKTINLNADVKRIWDSKFKAGDFLNRNETSNCCIMIDEIPEGWKV